jgi:hypothetical protein
MKLFSKCTPIFHDCPGFYQHFWNLCSEDIVKDCCMWLDTGQFPASLNSTNIALIPKGVTPSFYLIIFIKLESIYVIYLYI